ncbi:hypothetical protein A3K72_04235 [Candidatus Woesearchaeota archaeon RBG_13_36_6]|nr:MAG: hypothetical protein A3K72_04235 [Candidatus Woesearchaeota archaeon RBG_13_36_6]
MIVKTHISNDNKLILAICDNGLIGNKYEEGEKQLDLASSFYNGKKMEEEAVIELIEKAHIINAVGKDSVDCCLKAGVVDKNNIGRIKGIPYAYMVGF